MDGHPISAPEEVSPLEAQQLLEDGAFLLDVREPEEWEAGHVQSSVHIPLGKLQYQVSEVPVDRLVVCVCRVGGRSARAAAYLASSGYQVSNLAGGMQAWDAAGLPFVASDGGPGVVA